MNTAYETLQAAQSLGIELTVNGDQVHVKAPIGVMTLELKRALKAFKVDILLMLMLPEPAQPGVELEELRREIGEMIQAAERARMRRVSEARAYVGIPSWLIPNTPDWNKQVTRNGLREMLARRQAWFNQQKRPQDVVAAGAH